MTGHGNPKKRDVPAIIETTRKQIVLKKQTSRPWNHMLWCNVGNQLAVSPGSDPVLSPKLWTSQPMRSSIAW